MRPERTQPTAAETPHRCTLDNGTGMQAEFLTRGATLASLTLPVEDGRPLDVVLAYPERSDYLDNRQYLGCVVGRFANRIENARLRVQDRWYALANSNDLYGHCLHGGPDGFHHRDWRMVENAEPCTLELELDSADGDQGFPGALQARVIYQLLPGQELSVRFEASCDAPTVVNLAHHPYFNLNGDGSAASNHELIIHAQRYTPIKDNLIPSGELQEVRGTVFDFRRPVRIGARLGVDEPQLRPSGGFDHNYEIDGMPGTLRLAASLRSPLSGVRMDLHTTQPGLQFYSGQHLVTPFRPGQGICLEAQGFPNAPNTPGFPATLLLPGECYRQETRYVFRRGAGDL